MYFRLVPFESLGAVSYSPYIVTTAVTVAVCELFSVKACDLGNWVRSRSRSLKMGPFDRPYATFYNYNSILYHLEVFLTLNSIVTLKSRLEVTQGH